MPVTLRLTEQVEQELEKRFNEAKQEYPNLTLDTFISWAVRYYLQHAYKGDHDEQSTN